MRVTEQVDIKTLRPTVQPYQQGPGYPETVIAYDCGGGDWIFGEPGKWWCVGERASDGAFVAYGPPLPTLERAVTELNCCR